MKHTQDVIFITDSLKQTDDEAFWQIVRRSVHALRLYSVAKDTSLRIAFAALEDRGESSLSFCDFDMFAVQETARATYFSHSGFEALNYYFSTLSLGTKEKLPFVVMLCGQENAEEEKYRRLLSISTFAKTKKIVEKKDGWNLVPQKICAQKGLSLYNFSLPSTDFFKSKAFLLPAAIVCALVALVSLTLFTVSLVKNRSSRGSEIIEENALYKKVYTGDGDRLILRQKPEKNADEFLRIQEDEAVVVLQENITGDDGMYWDNVQYHGISGWVHSDYLTAANKEDYVIKNPEAMYAYGKACLLQFPAGQKDDKNGYVWIKKAAAENSISAFWDLYRAYEKGAFPDIERDPVMAQTYLRQIDTISVFFEEEEADRYRAKAKSASAALSKKFTDIANEKERNAKLIRRQAAKRLSEQYLQTNVQEASAYYKKALELGLSGDGDYMYTLAFSSGLSADDTLFWLKKASESGHFTSSSYLGNYYYQKQNYDLALTYYQAASKQGTGAMAPYYCGYINYHHKQRYAQAVSYFKQAVNSYDYSQEFYNANYYLGVCYEYGYGVNYASNSTALDYYNTARSKVSAANDAYNRLYKEVYGNGYYYW